MLIRKRKLEKLSQDVKKLIDGQEVDLRDNREGAFSILKNDIHVLANIRKEQVDVLKEDGDMLKDVLADISHQLKTPLTSMMIMADLLEDAPSEKRVEFITNIRTGLLRMEWLVSALLKMARFDAGVVEFSMGRIQSDKLIASALDPLHILMEMKNQQVEVAGGAELLCDSHWTAEALTNILKNASEYSENDKMIRVEVGQNPICAWISVTDGGKGIPHTEIPGLFKRFEGSRSEKGSGIGLPLALAIMRGQNGDIEVDGGGKGFGATFTLKFYK